MKVFLITIAVIFSISANSYAMSNAESAKICSEIDDGNSFYPSAIDPKNVHVSSVKLDPIHIDEIKRFLKKDKALSRALNLFQECVQNNSRSLKMFENEFDSKVRQSSAEKVKFVQSRDLIPVPKNINRQFNNEMRKFSNEICESKKLKSCSVNANRVYLSKSEQEEMRKYLIYCSQSVAIKNNCEEKTKSLVRLLFPNFIHGAHLENAVKVQVQDQEYEKCKDEMIEKSKAHQEVDRQLVFVKHALKAVGFSEDQLSDIRFADEMLNDLVAGKSSVLIFMYTPKDKNSIEAIASAEAAKEDAEAKRLIGLGVGSPNKQSTKKIIREELLELADKPQAFVYYPVSKDGDGKLLSEVGSGVLSYSSCSAGDFTTYVKKSRHIFSEESVQIPVQESVVESVEEAKASN
ncbi:MAG: hypothetical protein V4596_00470 [Bdellovibrionota bacterium]